MRPVARERRRGWLAGLVILLGTRPVLLGSVGIVPGHSLTWGRRSLTEDERCGK